MRWKQWTLKNTEEMGEQVNKVNIEDNTNKKEEKEASNILNTSQLLKNKKFKVVCIVMFYKTTYWVVFLLSFRNVIAYNRFIDYFNDKEDYI